jgi:riboflavin biosynthesis pyrimidine reductase
VWEAPDGAYETLRVGPDAPRAESDAIVLSAARARADAIITTGRILRDEPDLVHQSIASAGVTRELLAWRHALGRSGPPWIAVLTASGELPADHPALAAAGRLLLFTGEEGAARLRATSGLPAAAEIVEHPSPGAQVLVEHLRETRGARSILVEAGASTARTLYEGRGLVDELWLTVCRAPDVGSEHRVGAFVERRRIEATLGAPVHVEQHEDGGLAWATLVHRRSSDAG